MLGVPTKDFCKVKMTVMVKRMELNTILGGVVAH